MARREIRLTEDADGQWTARDLDTKVCVQGATRAEALDNLDAAVAAICGEVGDSSDADREPLGTRLRGLAVDLDIDSVAEVRELRER